jgi:hypothetical protein
VQTAVKYFDPIVRAALETSVYNTYNPEDSREDGEPFTTFHDVEKKRTKSYTQISIQTDTGAQSN